MFALLPKFHFISPKSKYTSRSNLLYLPLFFVDPTFNMPVDYAKRMNAVSILEYNLLKT